MSIPPILLAIALMALTRGSVGNVIIAITIAEIPRVSRLVRGVVLSLREQPYVEAAVAAGTRTPMIILRHILPNTLAPLMVQATYICARAMITEAILSFIGAGTPPTIPSWGNIMAEGRALWQVKPYIVFFPAMFLSRHRARGQSARRRPARRARSAHGEAAVAMAAADRAHGAARSRKPADPFPHARRRRTARSTASPSTSTRARRWRSSANPAAASRSPSMSILRLIPEPPGKIAGSHPLPGHATCCSCPSARCARIRGNDISMIFQEPMTSLNPVLTVGRQIGETLRLHQGLDARGRRGARGRDADAGRHPGAGAPACANIRTSSPAACASA